MLDEERERVLGRELFDHRVGQAAANLVVGVALLLAWTVAFVDRERVRRAHAAGRQGRSGHGRARGAAEWRTIVTQSTWVDVGHLARRRLARETHQEVLDVAAPDVGRVHACRRFGCAATRSAAASDTTCSSIAHVSHGPQRFARPVAVDLSQPRLRELAEVEVLSRAIAAQQPQPPHITRELLLGVQERLLDRPLDALEQNAARSMSRVGACRSSSTEWTPIRARWPTRRVKSPHALNSSSPCRASWTPTRNSSRSARAPTASTRTRPSTDTARDARRRQVSQSGLPS